MRHVTVLSLTVLLVLASIGPAATQSQPVEASAEVATTADVDDERPDPDEDTIGWENGYWHDESLDVDESDGLNDSELEVVRDRAMARVEHIRQKEFEATPEIELLSRDRYQNRDTAPYDAKPRRDQFYEAGFLVGEETMGARAYDRLYDVVTDGYYVDSITLIVNDVDSPRIDPLVLAHELTHALTLRGDVEDQMDERPGVKDWTTASGAALEGEASWVEHRYQQRCGETWECIERPGEGYDAVPDESVNMGLYLDFAASYTLGEDFVQQQYERDGIEGVDRMVGDLPQSSEQVIHPEKYGSDPPTNVTVSDRATGDWERIEPGEYDYPKTYNFGEAGLYVMLWYNGFVDTDPVNVTVGQQTGLNYSHPASAGWEGDVVVPYANQSERAYVFKSAWESEAEAREFHEAYLELLDQKGAEQVRENVYRIPDGPYADAFRVNRTGDTLLVVNAPTVDALSDVHGDADGRASTDSPTGSSATSSTATSAQSSTDASSSTDAETDTTPPAATSSPGFGPVAAAVALLGALVLLRRR